MAILLIGGAGYIGSELRRHLTERGLQADTVDLGWFGPGDSGNLSQDYATLDRNLLRRYDTLVLLAGHSSVAMCRREPDRALANNVSNFASLVAKLDGQRLIYASSISVYGADAAAREFTEDAPLPAPVSHYDFHKQAIDHCARLSGARCYGLRFGTVNGPSKNLRVDVMLNKMLHTARRLNRIEFCNPTVYRPILGISDLCRAVCTIVEREGEPGIYNLASFNATIGDMAHEAAAIARVPAVATHDTAGGYNVKVSTKKFERAFGFHFQDTTRSIVEALASRFEQCAHTVRD